MHRYLACCCVQVLAMGELIKAGKIKHWGVSNETTFGKSTKLCQVQPVTTARDLLALPMMQHEGGHLQSVTAPTCMSSPTWWGRSC